MEFNDKNIFNSVDRGGSGEVTNRGWSGEVLIKTLTRRPRSKPN